MCTDNAIPLQVNRPELGSSVCCRKMDGLSFLHYLQQLDKSQTLPWFNKCVTPNMCYQILISQL
ncbi:BnaA06g36280D [Brassica napus]|uniref:BnaA06g36280D protein n=1 Tax=Brassica napus TaxID=3708 RepID=A0A078GA87_BRANA|nr:BnaA06g36280D [Brassica napus]